MIPFHGQDKPNSQTQAQLNSHIIHSEGIENVEELFEVADYYVVSKFIDGPDWLQISMVPKLRIERIAYTPFYSELKWSLISFAVMILVMWLMIIERIIYALSGHKQFKKSIISNWQQRDERSSWNAEQIRQALVARAKLKLDQNLPLITTFVALCPLMGLLGTVTGMITVFDVMAVSGGGNIRSMASGVSQATIPTMAGMIGALSGVFANTWLQRNAKREIELLQDKLELEIQH